MTEQDKHVSQSLPAEARATGGRPLDLAQALRLAEQHRAGGRLAPAEQLCRQILGAHPAHPGALHLLALTRHQAGDTAGAIDLIGRAIAADGNVAMFHANLGEMYRLSGRLDEAVAAARRALELRPDYPEALSNLGIAHYERDELTDAVACYRRALELRPEFAEAYSNLGNALRALGDCDAAVEAYEQALDLRPTYADAYANLGTALHLMGRRRQAMSAFARALVLDPSQPNAHSGRALILLTEGRYAEGWREYEWRWQAGGRRPPALPRRWTGEPLAGRRLLVLAEQGYGDSMQFVRYLPLLREQGATVLFRGPPRLGELFACSMPWLEVFAEAGSPPAYDFHVPLLSIPGVVGTLVETIPAGVPYLRADPEASAAWRERLQSDPRVKVGLVWGGNPKHMNNAARSLTLRDLAPVIAMPGVRCVSLQVGAPAAELANPQGTGVFDPGEAALTPFAASAALVDNLDLVISIDTSVAHLAGAMGRPLWLLLSEVADWRWLLERGDSPWYPTARIYRQRQTGAWDEVVARIAADLAAVVAGDRGRLAPAGASLHAVLQ